MMQISYLIVAVLGVVLVQSEFLPPAFAEEKPLRSTPPRSKRRQGSRAASTKRRMCSRSRSREPT